MKLKQLLAVLLCFALLACCAPVALAAEDTATVLFWFADGNEITTAFDLTVTDGIAESYGYTVAQTDHNSEAIETVTAMDVLVAAHKAFYGEAFTAQTAHDYLVVNNSFITKAFGLETSNLGFLINDETPHDDTYVPAYGGYTGYAIDTARVQDGDRVCLYTIQDAYWSDVLPLFDKTDVTTVTGEAITVSVSGYSAVYYGCSTQDVIDENTSALNGVTVECTQDFKAFTPVGTLDAEGKLSVTLPEAGTYYLVVRGMFDDADLGDVPVIANFCTVTVTPVPDTVNVTFWFTNGSEITTAFDLAVTDGIAESYGYTMSGSDHNSVPVDTVTVLDVLVAAHKAVYGDAFTKETAETYLTFSYGYSTFATKAFGVETSNMGFTVNDATPHDDTYMESSYGGYYTGYALDTARVKDGDRVCMYVYRDAYWADMQALFDQTAIEAETNKAFTVGVSGYSIMFYGSDKQDVIDSNTKPLEGMTVECTQDFKTFTPVGTLDAEGKLSVTLPEAGTYYLVVRGMFDDADMGDIPVISNFCTVTAEDVVPVSLKVVSTPANSTFTYRKAPDFSGLVVSVQYDSGSERIVDDLSEMDIQPVSDARVRRGTQTYRVTVDGVSETFDMQVRLQIWQWLILIFLFGWIWY